MSARTLTRTPGYLVPSADPIGTQLWSQHHRGRRLHAVGCHVDTGDERFVHGLNGFVCEKCRETVEDRVETLLGRLDKQAGGRW